MLPLRVSGLASVSYDLVRPLPSVLDHFLCFILSLVSVLDHFLCFILRSGVRAAGSQCVSADSIEASVDTKERGCATSFA